MDAIVGMVCRSGRRNSLIGAPPAAAGFVLGGGYPTLSEGTAILDVSRGTLLNTRYGISSRNVTRGLALAIVLVAVPALLFVPILSYSLNTPFALVDDYYDWTWLEVLENPHSLSQWFYERFVSLDATGSRHRPFFEFYNMLVWKTFGPTPWLHHLSRWVFHFAAVFAFSAAFLAFPVEKQNPTFRFIPLALLVYLWLFFPNSPASRLAPQEVYSVFFLGLCTWMVALILLKRDDSPTATLGIHGVFFLGFLGLALSKETNIALMAWMLVFYPVLLLARRPPRVLLICIPLVLIFLHLFIKVLNAPGYGPTERENYVYWHSREILVGLFQFHTSLLLLALFTVLCILLLWNVFARVFKGRWDPELWFIVFLLGLAASMFAIVVVSWGVALRYWYVLIPIFALLMAYSCKYVLEYASHRPRLVWRLAPAMFVLFIAYFVGANYYNAMWQTVVQHDVRTIESRLIAEVTQLHDQGHHVYISESRDEHVFNLVRYFHGFAPRFLDKTYPRIATTQAAPESQLYYTVTLHRRSIAATEAESPVECATITSIVAQSEQRDSSLAYHIASVLQAGTPHRSRDAGVAWPTSYHWAIRRVSCPEVGGMNQGTRLPGEILMASTQELVDKPYPQTLLSRQGLPSCDRWGRHHGCLQRYMRGKSHNNESLRRQGGWSAGHPSRRFSVG